MVGLSCACQCPWWDCRDPDGAPSTAPSLAGAAAANIITMAPAPILARRVDRATAAARHSPAWTIRSCRCPRRSPPSSCTPPRGRSSRLASVPQHLAPCARAGRRSCMWPGQLTTPRPRTADEFVYIRPVFHRPNCLHPPPGLISIVSPAVAESSPVAPRLEPAIIPIQLPRASPSSASPSSSSAPRPTSHGLDAGAMEVPMVASLRSLAPRRSAASLRPSRSVLTPPWCTVPARGGAPPGSSSHRRDRNGDRHGARSLWRSTSGRWPSSSSSRPYLCPHEMTNVNVIIQKSWSPAKLTEGLTHVHPINLGTSLGTAIAGPAA